MFRLCVCGHRKYKHNHYPLDTVFCKGVNGGKIVGLTEEECFELCLCYKYVPLGNLEWLEQQVNNNHK